MPALLLATCAAVFVSGAAARSASPVFRVSFKVTAVGKSRPPNIVETRVAATGTLSFDTVPKAGVYARASSVSGKVVVEYDVLTPHPRTERLTVALHQGEFAEGETDTGAVTGQGVSLTGTVSASTSGANYLCPPGEAAVLVASRNVKTNTSTYVFRIGGECNIAHGQSAAIARNSRVDASFYPMCLRTTSGLSGKPLCGAAAGDYITISDGTATAGLYFSGAKNGTKTCAGGRGGTSAYSTCTDDQNVGATLPLTAKINGALPKGDEMWLVYGPPNGSDPTYQHCDPTIKSNCVLAKTDTEQTLKATVSLPSTKSFGRRRARG